MRTGRVRKLWLAMAVAGVALSVVGCQLGGGAERPTVTVTAPPSGTEVQVGEEVNVLSTSTDDKGVTRVELSADGSLYRTDASPSTGGDPSFTVTQAWTATTAGVHVLTVTAYDAEGQASDPWAITIRVLAGPGAEDTATPTTSAAATPTETAPPSPGPTDTPTPMLEPDLYITELTLDPVSPLQGEVVNVRVGISNRGNAPAEHHRVIWRSAGPAIGCEWGVASVPAGEVHVLECPYTYGGWNPSYVTIAIADADAEVAESDEDNNTLQLMVNVRQAPPQPDLYITEVTLDPVSPLQRQFVNVRVSVYNGGNAAAGHQKVIWRSAGSTIGCEWEVASVVARGGQVLSCIYMYGDWNHAYVTTALADADGEVVESDEGNNSLELIVDVRQAPPGPDLYISELTLDPVSPRQGELVNVRVSVYNGGTVAAGHHRVVWRSAGATIGCEWDVASLVARGGRVLTCTYTYGGWNHGYVTTAVADEDGEVVESIEDNNSRQLIVDVRP